MPLASIDGASEIRVGIRTGDTAAEGAPGAAAKKPPDILITTPESLYLMLTSRARETLNEESTGVILDEIHAVAGSKRGSHLALTLERLEALLDHPLQRIGLSATQRPSRRSRASSAQRQAAAGDDRRGSGAASRSTSR